ncbi:hypothetical protein [Streptomyces sp. G-G2]|uniref:hypothetical protein n=1 Tax=Streptomyces sp. G-G2 TaxID=3046201 RepID=UPI0024BA4E8E|nr:hypothetical protein [Streptomyces sp. G-G2]MDJ0382658.1 hypothetical protein [Streptomyces sp. G-G2]
MTDAWQNRDYGDLINHLTALRRRGRFDPDRAGSRGCAACRGVRRVVLVDGQRCVVYSEPCLACRGDGTTEKASTRA